jgi:predicted O-methyltransferase YrrM
MTFTEQWFGPESCKGLVALAGLIADVEGEIVEIGSWEGRSTCALANAVHPRVVHAVDHWHGSPGEPSAELAAGRDVFATWAANVAELTAGNVVAHRMGWRDYTPADSVAFVFIDAEHSYTEVRDTVNAYLPLMAAGGVICGDDVHHSPVRQALFEVLPALEIYTQATLWSWRKK